jgi:ribonucleoside-diphosphate reductase beta chain
MKDWNDPFSAGKCASVTPGNGIAEKSFTVNGSAAVEQEHHPSERVPLEALRPVKAEDKRIILGEADVNQLAPFAYPWAWEDFLKAQDNHWTPKEVEMAPDVSCYHSNPEFDSASRHIFENVFAQLVTFDVLAARSIQTAIMEKITAPEVSQYLVRQSFEESVHVWTYQHILETVGIEQTEVYNRYRTVPEIYHKVKMTTERLSAITDPYLDLRQVKNLDMFLMSYMFFAAVFEGLFFYHGFTPIFSLQRRGLMTASGTQLQYIMRDESLHYQFGIKVVNQIMLEQNYRPDPKAVQQMFEEAEDAEAAYAKYIMPKPVVGYSAEDHIEQFRFLANLRAKALGYLEPFPGAKCTTPWLDEQANLRKEKNFFEARVTEYRQSSSLKW